MSIHEINSQPVVPLEQSVEDYSAQQIEELTQKMKRVEQILILLEEKVNFSSGEEQARYIADYDNLYEQYSKIANEINYTMVVNGTEIFPNYDPTATAPAPTEVPAGQGQVLEKVATPSGAARIQSERPARQDQEPVQVAFLNNYSIENTQLFTDIYTQLSDADIRARLINTSALQGLNVSELSFTELQPALNNLATRIITVRGPGIEAKFAFNRINGQVTEISTASETEILALIGVKEVNQASIQGDLRMRSEPKTGNDANILMHIVPHDVYQIEETVDGDGGTWVKITANGQTGYVATFVGGLTITESIGLAPDALVPAYLANSSALEDAELLSTLGEGYLGRVLDGRPVAYNIENPGSVPDLYFDDNRGEWVPAEAFFFGEVDEEVERIPLQQTLVQEIQTSTGTYGVYTVEGQVDIDTNLNSRITGFSQEIIENGGFERGMRALKIDILMNLHPTIVNQYIDSEIDRKLTQEEAEALIDSGVDIILPLYLVEKYKDIKVNRVTDVASYDEGLDPDAMSKHLINLNSGFDFYFHEGVNPDEIEAGAERAWMSPIVYGQKGNIGIAHGFSVSEDGRIGVHVFNGGFRLQDATENDVRYGIQTSEFTFLAAVDGIRSMINGQPIPVPDGEFGDGMWSVYGELGGFDSYDAYYDAMKDFYNPNFPLVQFLVWE